MAEFAIWGIPAGANDETLLVAMPGGKPIVDRATAERMLGALQSVHGCRQCRIQILDGSMPKFGAESIARRP